MAPNCINEFIQRWFKTKLNAGFQDTFVLVNRAGVLVLGTRTHSTRVLNFWYSYCTRTCEFQSNNTCTCTRRQVLRYSYEYWHEYWYSMVHLWCKGENHHTWNKQLNNLIYDTCMRCDCKFHNVFEFYHHWKMNWITIMMFMFIVVIRPSPFSHLTSG